MWATDFSQEKPYGAVAFLLRLKSIGKVSFHYFKAFPEVSYGGEVIKMYVTWELLFTFCIVIINILTFVVIIFQNNKKK